MKIDKDLEAIEALGDNHIATSATTPLREDAFKLSDNDIIMVKC